MKKVLLIIFLNSISLYSRSQYFIPVFDNKLSKANACNALFADTVHNLLYASTYFYRALPKELDTSWLYAYRDGKLTQVGPTESFWDYGIGTCLSSGECVIMKGYNSDWAFYTLDSFSISHCYKSVCGEGLVYCLKSVHDTIYAGGAFGEFQNTNSYQIGGIDTLGNAFPLGIGVTSVGTSIRALEFFKGELYSGGGFHKIDTIKVSGLAKWNCFSWNSLGSELTGAAFVNVLKEYKYNLYVGGDFDSAGEVKGNSFARWTGNKWENIPEFDSIIIINFNALEVYHNKLYLLGRFRTKSFSYATGLFQYDENFLTHFILSDKLASISLTSLEVFNDTLFISGSFDSVGYIPAKKIVKFVDGTFSSYAPVATRWWHNSSAEGQQQPNSCYKYYEVARDTFVMNTPPTSGYNCRKIIAEQYLPDKTHTALQPLYVFGDTNRIMYYNNYQKRFVEGYKFNVKVGDTLTYYTPQPQSASDTTFRVIVDSITTLILQTENLKRIYTTPLDGWSFGNDGYAQLIGGLASMLPQPVSYFNNEGPLLCYQDTSLYYKYFTGGVTCDFPVSAVMKKKESKITISPNPAMDKLQITNDKLQIGDEITVTDLLGQTVIRTTQNAVRTTQIDVSGLPSGMYLLKARTKDGWVINKFIKQ